MALLKLSCAVQTYAWGKVGKDSEVVKLKENDPSFELKHDQSYAELWMGTHAKGPSIINYPPELKGVPLSEWINNNSWSLGDKVNKEFDGNFPFLFKVLSINKALSIQAHPTKDHAKILHATDPAHYPDPNHKPELVIALTQFEGLCSFRPFNEIRTFIQVIPELQTVLGSEVVRLFEHDLPSKVTLKTCFTALMKQDTEVVKDELSKLMKRLHQEQNLSQEMIDLLTKIYSWFPDDVGCWCCFFLNHIHLEEGESLYLSPNEPHAYIKGDVVECMACSDNVVRAGLTSKYKDKETLCSMLTYYMRTPIETVFVAKPHPSLDHVTVYDPPTPDFTVAKVTCKTDIEIPPIAGPSIYLIHKGGGTINSNGTVDSYAKGDVVFIPAGQSVQFKTCTSTVLYHAYCQV